jgi:ABC-type Mn2+/Zn2+ transport system ATPase subunit
MTPYIIFEDTTLGYGSKIILRNLTFTIEEGDYFGIVGPNGAGKTTMLRAILGVLKPISGTVRFQSSNGHLLRIGYVPQRDTIDDVLPYTVDEVVMMGRFHSIGRFRRPGKDNRLAVANALEHVGMSGLSGHIFKELSGGQKQRVLIARAIASEPTVLVLDEPTNGMDLPSRLSILDLTRRLHDQDHLTVILVSHLLDDVANHASRIAIVEQSFFQVGTVEEILTGRNLSALYRLPVDVETVHGRTIILAGGTNVAK